MAFPGIVLHPAKRSQGGFHKDRKKVIIVDGACPRESLFPSEWMIEDTTYRSGGTLGIC